MNALNLGSDDEPVVKKKSNTRNLKIALGLAAVILIPTIGSTLAGTITVGTQNTLEFGQGVTATTAWSPTITSTPTSALEGADFVLDSLVVTGINADCDEKNLTLKVLDPESDDPVAIGNAGALFCAINIEIIGAGDGGTSPWHSALNSCGTLSETSASAFTLTPATKPNTTTVGSITIESSTA